ncbi:MAG: iron-containing alcohol dehydrogenase [Spirochaetes bacterium]|jgi:alcohol dehydrogenase|nr:iron-containing alcohol dehydrogenase [Spirochaetota bacterium]
MIRSYYEYNNPVKIISGKKVIDLLPRELALMGASRPIIVTDRGVAGAGLIKIIEAAFAGSGASIGALYDDTPIDSSSDTVNEIAAIYRKSGCDSIIAVGGGSAIDTAKGVNILISEGGDDLLGIMGLNRLRNNPKPFIIIPTTAGTGSEVTAAAVIANPAKKIKMSFVSSRIMPHAAFLDPGMTLTMPPKITAATAMDALTHAVEAFVGLQKNPLSDAFAVSAIELIMANVVNAVRDGKNEEARLAMANGALLAGIAFSNSMVSIVHSVAHALGGVCHVPHGVANSIILPFGMEFDMKVSRDDLSGLLIHLAGPDVFANTKAGERAEKSVETVRNLASELNGLCGHPLRLSETGVTRDKFETVAYTALNDGSIQYSVRPVHIKDVMEILERAY